MLNLPVNIITAINQQDLVKIKPSKSDINVRILINGNDRVKSRYTCGHLMVVAPITCPLNGSQRLPW